MADYLLSSRHDPLVIGRWEIGVAISTSGETVTRSVSVSPVKSSVRSVIISASSSKIRANESPGLNAVFEWVINLCVDKQELKPKNNDGGSILLEDLPI